MLRLLSEAMSVMTWAYRLIVLAGIAFVLSTYGRTGSSTTAGTEGSYIQDLRQALAGLKEITRALQ
jgi:hypothetical protein